MMNVLVRRVGNEVVVVLPEEIARKLNVSEGGVLSVEAEPDGFRIRACAVRLEVMEAHRKSVEQFGELYKKLVE